MNQQAKREMREDPEKMKKWNAKWGKTRAFASRFLNILMGSILIFNCFFFLIGIVQAGLGILSVSWGILLLAYALCGVLFVYIEYRSVIFWELRAMGKKLSIGWWISLFLDKDAVPDHAIYDTESGSRGWYSSIAFLALLFFEPTTLLFFAMNASLAVFGAVSLAAWILVYLFSVVWEVADFKQEKGPGHFPFRILAPWVICLCIGLFLAAGWFFLV